MQEPALSPAGPTRFFTVDDGARLAYCLDGPEAGVPVLCLAGLTRTKEDFLTALPALAGCRVVRMDYRGRGESDFTGPATYTIAREGADALALMDHLGITAAGILGTSRGGLIGMFLAKVAKPRLLGLCLNDIGPEIGQDGLTAIIAGLGRAPTARSYAEIVPQMIANSPGFTGMSDAEWLAFAKTLFRETPEGLGLRYDPRLRESFLASFDPARPLPDIWPFWEATNGLPVTLIRGANSAILSRDTADRMLGLRPDLRYTEVPGRGHVPFLNEPEARLALTAWAGDLQ